MNGQDRTVEALIAQGFDASRPVDEDYVKPQCSRCEATVINGVACHESGCPNTKRECRGCNALIPMNHRFCEDCQ